jgi:prepilin-type processing-associated H-X9-DG protein
MIGFAVVSIILGLFTGFVISVQPVGHGDVLVGVGRMAAVSTAVLWCIACIWIRRRTASRGKHAKPSASMLVLGYGLLFFALVLVPGGISEGKCARRAACRSNLMHLGVPLHMYSTDHGERFPDRLSELYPDYAKHLSLFVCPSTGDKISSPDEIDRNTSYGYVTGLTSEDYPDRVLAYDKPGNHGYQFGSNVLFVDGHVRWMREEGLEKTLAEEERIRAGPQGTEPPSP